MTSYSDEEVKEAIAYTKGSETLPVIAELVWAASQYLKAKQVIEWYAEPGTYKPHNGIHDPKTGVTMDVYLPADIQFDAGRRAREFLNNK